MQPIEFYNMAQGHPPSLIDMWPVETTGPIMQCSLSCAKVWLRLQIRCGFQASGSLTTQQHFDSLILKSVNSTKWSLPQEQYICVTEGYFCFSPVAGHHRCNKVKKYLCCGVRVCVCEGGALIHNLEDWSSVPSSAIKFLYDWTIDFGLDCPATIVGTQMKNLEPQNSYSARVQISVSTFP